MISKSFLVSAAVALFVATLALGQTPKQIVVQAMPASGTPAVVQAAPVPPQSDQSVVKALSEIKATNDAILAKQAATLQQLDELEKAAEQIKIYSKRG